MGDALVIDAVPGAVHVSHPQLPSGLRAAIDDGSSVVLAARFSGVSGPAARKQCILDARQAAEALAKHGLDIEHLMPTDDEMQQWLRSAPNHRSVDASSRPFSNRFVEVWLTPNILLLLSVGTGSKLDVETMTQPFMVHLGETAVRLRPRLLFAKRWDRLGRRAWGLGPALDVLKAQRPSYLGDEKSIKELDKGTELLAFISSSEAEGFAAAIPRQTRQGMVSRSGATFVGGRVDYSIPAPPPPGLARLRMRGSGMGSNGQVIMCLETPSDLPDRDAVSIGYPNVIDPQSGEVVDQVENVRWALLRYADLSWSKERIGQGLIARKFSHTSIREKGGGPDEIAKPQPGQLAKSRYSRPASSIIDSILQNIDVYETGRLTRSLGVEGMADLVISGVFPSDGPWASTETFDAIRQRRQTGQRSWDYRRSLLLAGLPLIVNGQHAILRTYSGDKRSNPDEPGVPRYSIVDQQTKHSANVGVLLPHSGLARLVAEALDEAAREGIPLPRGIVNDDSQALIEAADIELTNARTREREARRRADALYDRIIDPTCDGSVRTRIQDDYNALDKDEIPTLTRDVELKERALSRLRVAVNNRRGVEVERLSELVRVLSNPMASDGRELVHDLISRLEIRLERFSEGHYTGWVGHTDIELSLVDESGRTRVLMRSGRILIGGAATVSRYAAAESDRCRAGKVERDAVGQKNVGMIARSLGMVGKQRQILAIGDPRLLRLAFGLFEMSQRLGRWDEALAVAASAELDAPEALVRRLIQLYGPDGTAQDRWWRQRFSWLARPITPCAHCQAPTILGALIAEIDVGLCPRCRLDASGVHWSEEYDHLLVTQDSQGPRLLTGERPNFNKRPKNVRYESWPA